MPPSTSQAATATIIPLKTGVFKLACSSCHLRASCLPMGLSGQPLLQLDAMVNTRRSLKRGEVLFHAGDPFRSLYAIRSGFFKSSMVSEEGLEQVTGFHMAGEVLGLDGIGTDRYACDAVALEHSHVCVIDYDQLESLSRQFSGLQHQLHKIMSREIVRDQSVMLLLGSMRAEERVAAFLLNLMQRLHARGFSPTALILRMSREEIGSYLGLQLETISRTFSKLQEDHILEVKQRDVRILDLEGLHKVLNKSP